MRVSAAHAINEPFHAYGVGLGLKRGGILEIICIDLHSGSVSS